MKKKFNWSVLIGASFLMATSSIGPGFLTQTALFTAQLGASFGFVILFSIAIDTIAQLNIWRVIVVADKPAQEIANQVFPGLGYFTSFLVFLGGMAFNIGNMAGAGLGMNVLFGMTVAHGAIVSAAIALTIFIYKETGKALDLFAKSFGVIKIGLALFIAFVSKPPLAEAIIRSVSPTHFSFTALLTIVGGTVGGYITFSGAHRLLDAGLAGKENLDKVNKGALGAIGLASLMRILLFLAALGVIHAGGKLNPDNPAASVFQLAAGSFGYTLFGIEIMSAGISSIVGTSYTSISFIKSFHPAILRYNRQFIIGFIITACIIFQIVGKPVKTLVMVGAINGFILPLSLGIMLIAAYKSKIISNYKQPLWLTIFGVLVVGIMAWMSCGAILQMMGH